MRGLEKRCIFPLLLPFHGNRSNMNGFVLCTLEKPFSYSRNIQSGSGRAGLTAVYNCCCSCDCECVCVCVCFELILTCVFLHKHSTRGMTEWIMSEGRGCRGAVYENKIHLNKNLSVSVIVMQRGPSAAEQPDLRS